MIKMQKFPEIGQFRNIVREISDRTRYNGKDEQGNPIYDGDKPLPTLTFTGTVKIHGTNSGITLSRVGDLYAQSREHIITTGKDNAGFAFYVDSNKAKILELFEVIKTWDEVKKADPDYITIFGEWCGTGIQSGVAVSKLPKMFVVFAIKLSYNDTENKVNFYLQDKLVSTIKNKDISIHNIFDFPTWNIDIDFNKPELAQNKIVDWVLEVERECPVGKAFGVEGIGEGIVFANNTDGARIIFKAKGEKHKGKNKTKVKTIAPVNAEKVASVREFAKNTVHEGRLNQAIERVFTNNGEQMDIRKLGDFLKWLVNDILKEEIDVLQVSSLEPKDVTSEISKLGRDWFLKKWNDFK